MDISFTCESCGQSIVIDGAAAGQLVDCPKCGKPIEVPYKSKPSVKAATPPPAPAPRPDSPVPGLVSAGPSTVASPLLKILGVVVVIAILLGGFFVYRVWNNQPRDFSVDVFIRTKGGENIKCGLVEIRVFESKDIESSQRQILKALTDLAPKIQTNLDSATVRRRKVITEWEQVRQEVSQAASEEKWWKKLLEIEEQGPPTMDSLKASQEALSAFQRKMRAEGVLQSKDTEKNSAEFAYNAALVKLREWPKTAYATMIERLPQPVTTLKTDADGRCTGKIPKPGKYVFAAYFSRLVGVEAEHICWLVWVNLEDKTPTKIMLSNDNTLGSGSSDSVFVDCPQPHLPGD